MFFGYDRMYSVTNMLMELGRSTQFQNNSRKQLRTAFDLRLIVIRSSADADNRRYAFSGQSRSTNMVPFWVRCDFSLSM